MALGDASIVKTLRLLAVLLSIMPLGCQTGHCRRSQKNIPAVELPAAPDVQKKSAGRKVKIYKYDGSLQCGQGKPIELKKMAQDLKQKNIEIYDMEKKPDGLMHIQVCGSPTGVANVFVISESDLGTASALGFKNWTFYD
jgi:hypothetical protein